jgi:hypothetical protein
MAFTHAKKVDKESFNKAKIQIRIRNTEYTQYYTYTHIHTVLYGTDYILYDTVPYYTVYHG